MAIITEGINTNRLPAEERPYERLERHGAPALSDAELLAILLRSGTKELNSLDLSRKLLREVPHAEHETGLKTLFSYNMAQLTSLCGIGSVKATQILAISEIARRLNESRLFDHARLNDPKGVAEYFYPRVLGLSREHLYGLWLDNRLSLLGQTLLSIGVSNAALVSSREIFLEALRYQAKHIILVHNHPSGCPQPSGEDIDTTARVKKAGELLEIRLLDHIIIGRGAYFSMKEEGLL